MQVGSCIVFAVHIPWVILCSRCLLLGKPRLKQVDRSGLIAGAKLVTPDLFS
jgi:hypothetical protein